MNANESVQMLQYARHYGLTHPPKPESSIIFPCNLGKEHFLQLDIADEAAAQPFLCTTVKEKLSCDNSAFAILRIVLAPQVLEHDEHLFDSRRRTKYKLELPLLKTDHELDVQQYLARQDEYDPDTSLPWPVEPRIEDENLLRLPKVLEMPFDYAHSVTTEKLEISKEALMLLRNIRVTTDYSKEQEEIYAEYLSYEKVHTLSSYESDRPDSMQRERLTTVTPPLSPMENESLSSSPNGLQTFTLPSDQTTCVSSEVQAIENQIYEKDAIHPASNHSIGDRTNELLNIVDANTLQQDFNGQLSTSSHGPSARPKSYNAEIEVPLSPPMITKPQRSGSAEFILDFIPYSSPDMLDTPLYDDVFENFIDFEGNRGRSAVEHEQLKEADSVARVPVPKLDFIADSFAVLASRQDEDNQHLIERFRIIGHERDSSMYDEESKLSWCPFPMQLGQVAIDESVCHDETLSTFLAPPLASDCIDATELTWKPEGLQILVNEDAAEEEEEEIQLGSSISAQIDTSNDFEAILKKRKIELDDTSSDTQDFMSLFKIHGPKIVHSQPEGGPNLKGPIMVKQHQGSEDAGGVFFSASEGLGRFMATQGRTMKKQRLNNNATSPPQILANRLPKTPSDPLVIAEVAKQTTVLKAEPLPFPGLEGQRQPRSIIVSVTVLQQRPLFRHISTLYPNLDLIERDYIARIHVSDTSHTTPTQPTYRNDEADITLSPSTGLLLTTLQKAKQKPLPGQAHDSALRTRIGAIAPRYEHLVVLVSAAGLITGRDLDARDCDALIELSAFAAALDHHVSITFVAGAEEHVARWIVHLLDRWAVSGNVKLLQEETMWEVFLRRAGMNACGAQVVLAMLKAPREESVDVDFGGDCYGLPAFILMSAEERVHRFERLLGGRKVLDRVSDILDVQFRERQGKVLQFS